MYLGFICLTARGNRVYGNKSAHLDGRQEGAIGYMGRQEYVF